MALKVSPNKQKTDSRKENSNKDVHDNADKKPAKKKSTQKQKETRRLVINQTINQSILAPTTSICYSYPTYLSLAYTPTVPVVTMPPYTTQYGMNPYYTEPSWSPFIPPMPSVPNPMYSIPMPPVPIPVMQPQILSTQVCPYSALMAPQIVTEPVLPVVPTSVYPFDLKVTSPNFEFYTNDRAVSFPISVNSSHFRDRTTENMRFAEYPLDKETCLSLPKALFPTARMMTLGSNAIINELCLEENIHNHIPWILDLEFGVPRTPVTRPIAIYDVQFNSIRCKNTPGAIHPGFESCSEDFKRVMLFYYDCVISSWYRGFIAVNSDTSVANFQSWLQIPMQVYGMCWP